MKSQLTDCTVANRTIVKARATIGEGAVVGERCVIGEAATIRAASALWPEKNVTSGAIVSMSLIYGIKWPGSLFGGVGVTGLANLEITPEFALKLGQAFGSFLRPGDTVMTSRDTHPASRIMNRCVISGLLSVGSERRGPALVPVAALALCNACRRKWRACTFARRRTIRTRCSSSFSIVPASTSTKPPSARSRICSFAKTSGASRWMTSGC